MKKWLKILVWTIGFILLASVGTGIAFYKRFVVNPPSYDFPPPQNLKEAQRQDLEYLSLYPEYDRSFDSKAKRDSFYTQLKRIDAKLPISRGKFEMEVSKALAFADNCHTNVSAGARARRLQTVPLRFYWFREGLFAILAKEEYKDVLGKRITKINGIPPEELLARLKPWQGGTEEDLKKQSPLYFISPEIMNAIDFGDNKEELNIEYMDDDRLKTKVISNSQSNNDVPGFWPAYWLHPYPKIKGSEWLSCKPDSLNALPFHYMEQNVHHQFLGNALYVQINDNYNTEERNLRKYLKRVAVEINKKNPDQIIFDLRFNPGGNNYHLPWPFIKFMNDYLTEGQKCWIVTGHATSSAGLITAAFAKYTLGEKSMVIGEKVGDRMQFWADGGVKMQLPNSKISPGIWTAYNDWENGCKDFNKCFWITLFDGVAAGNLNPDKEIALSFNDYMSGNDSVLDYILNQQ